MNYHSLAVWGHCLCTGLSLAGAGGCALGGCGPLCGGFSRCRAGLAAVGFDSCGWRLQSAGSVVVPSLAALRLVRFCKTRDHTCAPCIARQILNHWATREALRTICFFLCPVLAWRIPGTGEPDGLPSMGSHRVGHN